MARNDQPRRCDWALQSEEERIYHDKEWGVPVFDDAHQFEFLVLESAQAGLSWLTILKKREAYRKAFAGFDPKTVSRFNESDVERLMQDPGIVRNRQKIEAAINNAKAFLEIQKEFGTFCNYIWGFVDGNPIQNNFKKMEDVPAETELSRTIAKDLKKRGFKFLGPVTVYAHMQATGIVNDHLVHCQRYAEVAGYTLNLP